jgi:hypothetical protein
MTAIATEERATVSAERPRSRVLLAQRMKPQREENTARRPAYQPVLSEAVTLAGSAVCRT